MGLPPESLQRRDASTARLAKEQRLKPSQRKYVTVQQRANIACRTPDSQYPAFPSRFDSPPPPIVSPRDASRQAERCITYIQTSYNALASCTRGTANASSLFFVCSREIILLCISHVRDAASSCRPYFPERLRHPTMPRTTPSRSRGT